jgi:NAD(P)-dependent dehydrogenase (short-subunit alcohol dehydrogenase family)
VASLTDRRLEGKVALVTGAASGNGRAIALRYAREGAAVVVADVRELPDAAGVEDEKGVSTHALIDRDGGRSAFVRCDVTSGEEVRAAVTAAVESFGRLDIAVANAGINLDVLDLVDEPFEQYERVVGVNQHGVWWTCKEAARRLVEQADGGRIIALASIAGLVGTPTGVAYSSSKGAVVQLVRTLALQLAPHGITVNAICPGWVRTAMTTETRNDPVLLERALAAHPLGRVGEAEDVAGAAFFLASDDAAWVTGIALPVDGGYTCV